MLFNSLHFIIFLPIVLLVYFVIPKKVRYVWLLAVSYYFYMSWNPTYVLLLLLSTLSTYIGGLLLGHWQDNEKARKAVIATNLVLNFGILFLFKYFNFAYETLEKVLSKVSVAMPENRLDLLLPVGISFYIFQVVGYTIDVYRGKIAPERNFLLYALFVSFFPQLVAGPIERSTNMLPQIKNIDKVNLWNCRRIQSGAVVMLYGFILKMVLADRAALYVDTVFHVESYGQYQGFTVLIAMILFALQIYCDFGGYTYIAIGAARIMGVDLMHNFESPYFATSIKAFWDRWHISLSTWFRDYLYFPLGGSRKGTLRKYVNIMIVFAVSGLWHGAAWTYVFWGFLHGMMRVIGEATQKVRDRLWAKCHVATEVFSFKLWRVLCTFSLVTLAWTIFRAASLHQAVTIIKNLFSKWNPWVLTDGSLFTLGLDAKDWNVLLIAALLLFVVDFLRYKKYRLTEWFLQQNLLFRCIILYVGIMFVVLCGIYGAGYDAAQFIYFQF